MGVNFTSYLFHGFFKTFIIIAVLFYITMYLIFGTWDKWREYNINYAKEKSNVGEYHHLIENPKENESIVDKLLNSL